MRDPLGIVGTTIDRRYDVKRVVAEGGFGVVYEALAVALGVRVALKVLRSEAIASSPEARIRFDQEAKLLARLRHPGIVSLTDASHLDDGTPYLVLEWIEGETLDAHLRRIGPMPLDDALRLLGPVASAITYAHGEGVIHRDLKPANLMVTRAGARVLDFGVARWSHESGVKTSTVSGTGLSIGYGAPEQYGKEFGPVDGRADQFALAAVVFSALTAKPPFVGESLTEVMFATCMSKERPSLDAHRDDLPHDIDSVVRRALAIRPADRFDSIRTFWGALEAAAQHHGDDAPSTQADAAPRTVVRAHAAVGRMPEPATLPSPVRPAPDARPSSMELGPTQPAPRSPTHSPNHSPNHSTAGATVRDGAAPPSSAPRSIPESSVRSARMGTGSRVLLFLALGGIVGGSIYAAQPLFSPSRPPKPPTTSPSKSNKPGTASATPSTSTSTSTSASAEASACGTDLLPDEACILGARLHRGPTDCASAGTDPWHRASCPSNSVLVATFALDKKEVSVARWATCVTAGKCRAIAPPNEKGDDAALPVRNVTFLDALAFCGFDRSRRLPTDDEWELAAAGSIHREYPWGNGAPSKAFAIYAETDAPTAPSSTDGLVFGATPEGVFHLAGNVAEWTSTKAPTNAPWPMVVEVDPDKTDTRRWVRGGSFQSSWDALRTWAREAYPETHHGPGIGFRCARSIKK